MARRIITAEDVGAMSTGEQLLLDEQTTLTAPARELARRRGVEIVELVGDEAVGARGGNAGGALGARAAGDGGAGGRGAGGASPSGTDPQSAHDVVDADAERRGMPAGRLIVTAVGVNRPGILSEVTAAIGSLNGDIRDVSQLLHGGYFNAILIVDISPSGQTFTAFRDALRQLSKPTDYEVTVIDERVFQAMHRI